MIKTIPKKKKCKKAKWLSEEALQIVEKRREVKDKREKERYIHLNAEIQRIARRINKAFLSDQCKEIEQKNRVGKTRDLFKKIRDNQGNISCKDGQNKGEKWYGPNRSRRYEEKVSTTHRTIQKKDLNDLDKHDGVITHLKPDIWSVKLSGP